jgi:peroxiredoxin
VKNRWFTLLVTLCLNQALPAQISVGDSVPNFTLPDLNGQMRQLQEYVGDIILINFFASWCPPCQVEAPQLEDSIWQVYQNDQVTVLGVDLQEPAFIVSQFMQQYNLTYPVVLDTDGSVFSAYGFTILPSNVLVGRDGKIVWIEEGFVPRTLELGIYPNPTNSTVKVEFPVEGIREYTISLYDVSGRLVSRQEYQNFIEGEKKIHLINLHQESSGIYFLTVETDHWRTTRKITLIR